MLKLVIKKFYNKFNYLNKYLDITLFLLSSHFSKYQLYNL